MNLKTLVLGLMLIPTIGFASSIKSDIGRGLSRHNEKTEIKDRCINTLFDHNIYREDIRSTNYSLALIKNKEELYEKLTTSSSSKASYSVFNAGLKHSFVKEINWNFNSNYILVKATRISYKESIASDNILLSERSKKLLLNSKFSFLESCGSYFAQNIYYGGEIYGVIEIYSSTHEEKKNIEASLEASGKFKLGSASGKAKFSHSIKEISSQYRNKVSFRHIGGKQVDAPTEVDELLNLSIKIEEITDQNPVAIEYDTREYNTLANFEHNDLNYETLIKQDQIDFAQKKLTDARSMYANILAVLEYPEAFNYFDHNYLNQKLIFLELKIIELKSFIHKSYNFLNDTDINEISFDLNVNLPSRRLTRAGLFGGKKESELPIKCEMKESPICGVENYKTMKSAACDVTGPKTGTGPICGTTYNTMASEYCGIKLYAMKRGEVCGVQRYRECRSKKCGKNWDGSRKRCRISRCGVEEYNLCRDKSFGVEEYNICTHQNHGIKEYGTCSDKDFGYNFKSCQHISHGPEKYKTCNIAKIGSQTTFCPQL